MLYHFELFEYTLSQFVHDLPYFGIGMAKFLGFQNQGFLRGNNNN